MIREIVFERYPRKNLYRKSARLVVDNPTLTKKSLSTGAEKISVR